MLGVQKGMETWLWTLLEFLSRGRCGLFPVPQKEGGEEQALGPWGPLGHALLCPGALGAPSLPS